ncbi:alanine racemase [Pedococcus sp. 5OH_020]|uniref:alanine racemase n=1 Tax=Pedococcus sp. 5OH_020 TaxID=2989814 RepID=UPI0022E9DC3C|nr:alanine racemase [Pedococcus sp. 5OH_020]
MPRHSPLGLDDISTPSVVVDEDVLRANVARMASQAAALGVALRPHAKTHKSPNVARLQLSAGAIGLTVATLSEAVVFAEAGCADLFVAYPLWFDAGRAALLGRALDAGAVVTVGCDSLLAAQRLASTVPAPGRVRVLVEVDSGHHRSGVAPSAAGDVAAAVASTGLDVAGVFTFPGHSYAPDRRELAARQEATSLREAAESLRGKGLACDIVSGGSTPSIAFADPGVLTELRPGVYVFGDAQQWELGACAPQEIALTVLATVVSRRPGVVVLDAGSKALGADRPPWASGGGRLLDQPAARITQLSEHHAVVEGADLALGERVRVVPNHVCNTVNLADDLVVVRAGEAVDRWPVTARGANH